MERITFILTWVFQGSNYLSAYGYGVMHRMHHAYADTEKDPHSPKYDLNIISMMWKTKNIYYQINKQQIEVAPKFTKNVPQWKRFDDFASSWVSRLAWSIAYFSFFFDVHNFSLAMVAISGCFADGTHTWSYYKLVWSHFWICKFQIQGHLQKPV